MQPSLLISGIPSLVPFVGPETLERRLGRRFVLRLGANESLFGPSPKAVEAMAAKGATGQFYCDPEGWELRLALAEAHGVRPEEVVLGAGIDELLALLCRAYCDPGSPVVTTAGSYPTFDYGAMGAGAEVHRIPYRNDAIDLAALSCRAREVQARVVYLANPDNPSGSWHTSAKIEAFRAELPASALLLLDEAYADFAPPEALPPMGADDPGVIRLRTFSKAHGMAGLRVAYAVGDQDTVQILNRIRMHFGVSSVAQAGALASLKDQGHVQHVVKETVLGRARLAEIGQSVGLTPLPSATNFLLLDAGSRAAADELLEKLLNAGVFVRKPGQPPLDRCIRVTIGRPEDMDTFEQILRKLADAERHYA